MFSQPVDLIKEVMEHEAKGFPPIAGHSQFGNNLQQFLRKLYSEIAGQSQPLPQSVSLLQPHDLSRFAYNLIMYRAALADVHLAQALFNADYLAFIQTDNLYTKGLSKPNPFVLRAHIIQLFNQAYHACEQPDGL